MAAILDFSPIPRDTQQETNFSNMFTAIISSIWDLKKNSLASPCLVQDIRKELRPKRKEPFWMLCFDKFHFIKATRTLCDSSPWL